MISVIITSYGEPDGLRRAIESLLHQSYQDIEIIVVDDNDPDTVHRKKTEKLMAFFTDNRVTYLKHKKNKNGAAARNTGIRAAKGEYICFLDSDDFYFTDRFSHTMEYFQNHKDYDGVCCGVLLISNTIPKELHKIKINGNVYESMLNDEKLMFLGTGSNIFLRRSVLDDVKGFDERFHRFQDVEFMLRVSKNHKIGTIDSVDIVKVNSGLHSINFKKLNVATELLIDKFRGDIDSLPEEKKIGFYDARYTQLLAAAFNSGTEQEIEQTKQLLQTIRPLSESERSIEKKLKAYRKKRKFKGKILNSKMFCFVNSCLKRKRTRKIYRELTEKKAKEIQSFLKNK